MDTASEGDDDISDVLIVRVGLPKDGTIIAGPRGSLSQRIRLTTLCATGTHTDMIRLLFILDIFSRKV